MSNKIKKVISGLILGMFFVLPSIAFGASGINGVVSLVFVDNQLNMVFQKNNSNIGILLYKNNSYIGFYTFTTVVPNHRYNIYTTSSGNNYTVFYKNDTTNPCIGMNLTRCTLIANNLSWYSKNFHNINDELLPGLYNFPTQPIGISILGGTAPSVGTPLDGTNFVSGLTASVGSTMDGLAPFDALIGGMILAFVIITWMLKLYYLKENKK